jgi:signal transduction histidine kinase
MAGHITNAIHNAQRHEKLRGQVDELIKSEVEGQRAAQRARTQIEDLTRQMTSAQEETNTLRQVRDQLELKLADSNAEQETLVRRLAEAQSSFAQGQERGFLTAGARMGRGVEDLGILLTNAEGVILTFNAAADRLLRGKGSRLLGTELGRLSDDERWLGTIGSALRGEEAEVTAQLGAVTLMCQASPLPDPKSPSGALRGLVVLLYEHSPDSVMEKARIQSVAALLDELRSPASTVIGYADLLLSEAMGNVEEVQRKFLLRIKSSAERMARVVSDLAAEASTDGRGEELEWRPIQVAGLVEGTLAAAATQLQGKELDVDLDLDEELPLIYGDPARLERVLSCLISNALLASPPGGVIQIRAARSDEQPAERELLGHGSQGFVTLSVQDSVVGLSG